ncbi:MAG: peptide/nickel transport system permease protein [Methanofollis sp.]|nr:peptide/nickel transport system permease protein [Methanofollis sp.]
MHQYLTKRIGSMVLTLFAISMVTFFLMNAIPGGTAEMVVKHTFVGLEQQASSAQLQEISSRYDLKKPIIVQYCNWVSGALLHGDFGTSYAYQKPVTAVILLRLPATLMLALASMLIVLVVGIPLGIYSAIHENRLSDIIIRVASIFTMSVPGFWLALILIMIFSIGLGLFPTSGYGTPYHLVLPALALSAHTTAVTIRIMRTGMLETLGKPFITFAIAKGLPTKYIITRHAFRNALLPVVTVLGIYFGHMLAGTMVIEQIYAWPGIGSLLINSVLARDIPVVEGCVLVIVALVLLVNFAVDLLYLAIDPRIHYE